MVRFTRCMAAFKAVSDFISLCNSASSTTSPAMRSPYEPILQTPQPQEPYRDNSSAYSLATVHDPSPTPTQHTSLLSPSAADQRYGAVPPSQPSTRRILFNATLKMAVIFILSTALLGATLWLALPTLEECVSFIVSSPAFAYASYLLSVMIGRT